MAGFENDVLVAANLNFDDAAGPAHLGIITAAGMLPIGTGNLAPTPEILGGSLVSPNSSITIGYISPNITLQAGGAVATTYQEDSGVAVPVANILNVLGLSGSKTSGAANTVIIKSPPFSQVGASATSSLNSGEFVTAAVTRTLPVSAGLADGDLFIYSCTTAAALVIQAVGAQRIRIGTLLSSAAGTATSTAIGDSLTLRFDATQGFFMAVGVIGTWLIA